MDISVTTAGEASDRAAPPEESAATEPASGAQRSQPRYPRSGGASLPTGPDPAMIFKYVKIGAIVVGALLVILILKTVFSGGSPAPAAPAPRTNTAPVAENPASSTPAASTSPNSYKLIAADTVRVRVTKLIGIDTDGEEVYSGTLTKGQSVTIPWNESQNVWASAGENLRVESNGVVSKVGFTGYDHGQMLKKTPAAR